MAYPTTFLDLQNSVIAKLRMDATADLSKVKDWINQVYADVCVETEAVQQAATMTLTSGSASYTLPAGILRIKEMFVTPVGGVQSMPLRQTNLDEILRRRQSSGGVAVSTGGVSHYALLGLTDFEVYPTPSAADVITIYYSALPTALSADADVPVMQEPWASKMLEYGALAEAADYKSDPQEGEYRQLFEAWKQRFRSHLIHRQGLQTQQFDIVPAGNYPPHDPSTDLR